MNTGTLLIRQLFKVDKDVQSYLRVFRGKLRRITMSTSLLQDEAAAYEVSHSARVIHGCKNVMLYTPVSLHPMRPSVHTPTASSDGTERPADQCSCPGADQTEWCTPAEGNGANVPLPQSDKLESEREQKLHTCILHLLATTLRKHIILLLYFNR